MRELVEMDVRRVALVDKAANRRTFLLWKREEEEDMSEEKGKKKEEETPVKKKEEETGLPIEVEAAGLPDGVKKVISSTLRDLNKSIAGLAKLMGYGLNMPTEEKKETVKEDTEEEKKKDDAIEQAIGDLASAVKDISESIVTRDEVAKMLEEITGKKPEEKKEEEEEKKGEE